jgi:hypothetical protein
LKSVTEVAPIYLKLFFNRKSLIPIVDRIRRRFSIKRFCIVADRGMISQETLERLEAPDRDLQYILGARLRKVKEIRRYTQYARLFSSHLSSLWQGERISINPYDS